MSIQTAYDEWAEQYDSDKNRTRDLEASCLRSILAGIYPHHCLEIGCGTGKNTVWLQSIAARVTAVDFSEGMLAEAKRKVDQTNVGFVKADITQAWDFHQEPVGLIVFSLVLEHIEGLEPIFQRAAAVLLPGGFLYVGELHPFKQYLGTKARFESRTGITEIPCFVHHISEFIQAAQRAELELVKFSEFFDDDRGLPRILGLVFRKLN